MAGISKKPRIYLNPLPQIEGASWIDLSQGHYSLVDTEVALIAPKFYLRRYKNNDILYGICNIKVDDKWVKQYLHRFVFEYYKLGAPEEIDHINRNGLDNRRNNLRPATSIQNKGNTDLRSTNKSGYKGVYWVEEKEKYCAAIYIDGKTKFLGYFDNPINAGRVFDRAAIAKWGLEVAWTNFPKEDYK